MSLDALVSPNTQKARATARNAFVRFFEANGVDEQFLHECIERDRTGACLMAVVDRFEFYLASCDSKSGNPLSKSSIMSYYGQVKNWLVDRHNYLRPLVSYRKFSRARNATDYQDAALMCLMWHNFGCASDLSFVQKQHLIVFAGGVFYMRILRVKTSQEQGLTLVPDKDRFLTCPLFALVAALAMQDAPSPALLTQLPALVTPPAIAGDPTVRLLELLRGDPADPAPLGVAACSMAPRPKAFKLGDIGIHGYINRLLRRIDLPGRVTQDLIFHSFRRGGAQHANSDDRLAPQWIFGRGAWNLGTMNKGFAYAFNTPREDRKVARVLSDWQPDDSLIITDISKLDHAALEQLQRFRSSLFSSCSGLADTRLNVCDKVLAMLTTYVVRNFPQLKAPNPEAPMVKRIEQRAAQAGVPIVELLTWSVAL